MTIATTYGPTLPTYNGRTDFALAEALSKVPAQVQDKAQKTAKVDEKVKTELASYGY